MGKVIFLNILFLGTVFCFNAWSQTDPAFAGIITDHMVLQRGVPVSVWGYAEPGEKIKVSFWDQEKETVTAQEGCWEIYLDP
jgi:sialate O-acetylesterase